MRFENGQPRQIRRHRPTSQLRSQRIMQRLLSRLEPHDDERRTSTGLLRADCVMAVHPYPVSPPVSPGLRHRCPVATMAGFVACCDATDGWYLFDCSLPAHHGIARRMNAADPWRHAQRRIRGIGVRLGAQHFDRPSALWSSTKLAPPEGRTRTPRPGVRVSHTVIPPGTTAVTPMMAFPRMRGSKGRDRTRMGGRGIPERPARATPGRGTSPRT